MHNLISKLIVYRNMDEPILTNLSAIFKEFESGNYDKDELIADIYTQINNLENVRIKRIKQKDTFKLLDRLIKEA